MQDPSSPFASLRARRAPSVINICSCSRRRCPSLSFFDHLWTQPQASQTDAHALPRGLRVRGRVGRGGRSSRYGSTASTDPDPFSSGKLFSARFHQPWPPFGVDDGRSDAPHPDFGQILQPGHARGYAVGWKQSAEEGADRYGCRAASQGVQVEEVGHEPFGRE
jgi:hypothetical protein